MDINNYHLEPPERPAMSWNLADCVNDSVNIGSTFSCGQVFRWRRQHDGIWVGSIGDTVAALWQPAGYTDHFYWQTFPRADRWDVVRHYLNLDNNLTALQMQWCATEPLTADLFAQHTGLRLLRQPVEECLFSFQCATCNTVTKIERSVEALARNYGTRIDTPLGEFSLFPDMRTIAGASEIVLRNELWGYRAPRVILLAQIIVDRPCCWLNDLINVEYREAHSALTELPGLGAKLADCVCLFCLDKWEAIPVDTHVRQLAQRLRMPETSSRSLTPTNYNLIANAYRGRYGAFAGWAQQILFYSELRRSRNPLPG